MLRLIPFTHQFVSSCAIVLARDEVCQLPSEPVRRVLRVGSMNFFMVVEVMRISIRKKSLHHTCAFNQAGLDGGSLDQRARDRLLDRIEMWAVGVIQKVPD